MIKYKGQNMWRARRIASDIVYIAPVIMIMHCGCIYGDRARSACFPLSQIGFSYNFANESHYVVISISYFILIVMLLRVNYDGRARAYYFIDQKFNFTLDRYIESA